MDKSADDIRHLDDAVFLEKVRPELEQLESIRKVKLVSYLFRKKVGIVGGVLATPLTGFIDWWLVQSCSGDDCGAGLTFALWAGLYAWIIIPKKQYAKAYKKEILPDIAKLFGDFVYKADGKIPGNAMKPSKILPRYDRYKSEDYFEGTYKGTTITFSEINLEQRRRSNKRTYYVSVFKGLAVLITMPKNKFFGHTIMMKNKTSVGEWLKAKDTGLKRANLVDPEFEKQYDVFTNDQTEARYLIDPNMIERIKALAGLYETDGISAAYYEDKMLLLLPTKKNFFEPADIKVKATDPESVISMKREVGHMMHLVDHLELYDSRKVHQKQA